MDSLWAKRGKVTRKRTIVQSESHATVDYEIQGKWIADCYVYENKDELKGAIIHSIDYNSSKE